MATAIEKALTTALTRHANNRDGSVLLAELHALGFDVVAKRKTASRVLKAALVLVCGCKVKIDPNVNPDAADRIPELEAFHAEIHAMQQAHHEREAARPAPLPATSVPTITRTIPPSPLAPLGYGQRLLVTGNGYYSELKGIERYMPDGTVIGQFTVSGKPLETAQVAA